jgi:hypothetical protein
MQVLAWLLIPLAATILAIVWVRWRSRAPRPADPEQGMEDMARFREAMSKPLPAMPRQEGQLGESTDDDRGAAR